MTADDQIPAATSPTRVVAGRFRLGPRRGSSIDAALFEAFDEELQRPVVVKLVHPDTSARPDVQAEFRAKMELAGALHHPNISVAHSWGTTDWNGHRVLFVVSEQLTGGSVRDMLDRGRTLSPSQALLLGLDACKALDVLHRKGLIHGDIRPGTLVFGDDRRLRVLDPGLSEVLAIADDNVHRSNDLAKYASPEQAQNQPITSKSDVYSLCLTLFETLTGTVPFVGDSTVATLQNRIDRLLPVSADLGALASVLERAGRPDPADRYTAAEFGRALVQAAERLPRPEPLPILVNSLFGADTSAAGDMTDPTGVLRMPPLPEREGVEPVQAPPSADGATPAAFPAPVLADSHLDDHPETALPSVGPVLAAPVPAPTGVAVAAAEDGIDPHDEFPEHPPTPGRFRRWLILLLVLLAIAGGVLAWYSARPEMRTVPPLANMEQGVALNAVAGDFQGVLAQESSETVAAGHVIRTDPATGTELKKDSAITLFVSTGPAPRVVPELAGLTVADASQQLRDLGLVVEVGDPVFDEKVAKDVVLRWTVPDSPALVAGGTVTKGTAVRLVASAGPEPRSVPDVVGTTLQAARAALAKAQLVLAQGEGVYDAKVPRGRAVSQTPAPGSSVDRGSKVTVVFSRGHAPVKIPAITETTPAQVRAKLKAAGFVFAGSKGDPSLPFIGLTVGGKPAKTGQEFPFHTKVVAVYTAATPAP